MSDSWIKALILACTFGAVILAIDVLVRWFASTQAESKAINFRLKLIGQGRSHGEVLNLLRRAGSILPEGLPAGLRVLGLKFERMLIASQVTIPTGRLMLIILLAPFVIFFALLMILVTAELPIGFGRILLLGTFSLLLGGALPIMALSIKANRTRKKMQGQFPVALDVFVRGLRAGHPIAAALDLLTVEMPDP